MQEPQERTDHCHIESLQFVKRVEVAKSLQDKARNVGSIDEVTVTKIVDGKQRKIFY